MSNRIEHGFEINQKTEKILASLPDIVSGWYYNLYASDKTPMTCYSYVQGVKRFFDYCEEKHPGFELPSVSETDVTKYLLSLKNKTVDGKIVKMSDSYRQTNWTILESFFSYANKHGIINRNYVGDIDRPTNKDIVTRYYLTSEDFKKILEAVKNGAGNDIAKKKQQKFMNRDLLIISLFMCTGMRATALTEINFDDIDFKNQILHVWDKGEVPHEYYLEDNMMDLLRSWLRDRLVILNGERTQALFISNRKQRISYISVYNLIKKYSKEGLGYEISPHKLRAGFCTILYNETKDINFVKEAVGHRRAETTELYIQTDKTDKIKAAKIMKGVII